MDLSSSAHLRAPPDRVFAEVANLDTYSGWLGIVSGARRVDGTDADAGPAWSMDLVGRIGPLRRTKTLRMVRVEARPPTLVRFERQEVDGGQNSAWVLTAEVEAADGGSQLTIGLHYGGAGRIPGLDRLLRDEIVKATKRLGKRLR